MDWQPVKGWPHYEVSDDGRLRTLDGRSVGQWPNDQGYMMARLSRPRKMVRVHRLVAEAFVPNPSGFSTVNHLNNDRADNRTANIEWCSQQHNLAHADKQGRMCRDYWQGKRSPNARLSDADVLTMRATYGVGGSSYEAVGKRFGVSKRAAMRAIKGETYADIR